MNLFSFLIGIGASLGLLHVVRRNLQDQAVGWAAAGLAVLAAGLIGARANYVLLHPGLFAAAPLDALRIWLGGLSWPGALLFGLLALLGVSFVLHIPFGRAADALAPLFPIVAVMAWLGCSQAGCAYGSQISPDNFWAMRLPDEQGVLAYRWPLQLAAALSLLVLVWRVDLGNSGPKRPVGWLASSIGLALALHTFVFSSLRVDTPPVWGLTRLDLAAAVVLAAICVLGLIWLGIRQLRASFADKAPGANRESWFSPRD